MVNLIDYSKDVNDIDRYRKFYTSYPLHTHICSFGKCTICGMCMATTSHTLKGSGDLK
jgi:hypothetical protein